MKKLIILFTTLLVLSLTSCSQASQNVPTPSPADPGVGLNDVPPGFEQPAQDNSANIDETMKYGFYIDYANWLTEWILTHAGYYFQEFGIENEPTIDTAKESYSLTELEEVNWQYPTIATEYSAVQPDYGNADACMKTLSADTLTFMDAYSEACKYYNNNKPANVTKAKADELHTNMLSAYNGLWASTLDFFQSLDAVTLQKQEDDIRQLAEDGYLVHSNAVGAINEANKMEKQFYDLSSQGQNFLKADATKFESNLVSFKDRLTELTKLSKDNNQMEFEELNGDRGQYLTNLIEDSEIFSEIATDMLVMIKAGNVDMFDKYTAGPSEETKFNPYEQLGVMLQNMIYDYNYMVE